MVDDIIDVNTVDFVAMKSKETLKNWSRRSVEQRKI